MASKGEVVMKFDAQTGAFVQNILQAQRAMQEMGDKARKFGTDFANSGDEGMSALKGIASHLGVVTSAAGLAAAAVRLLTAAWADNERHEKEQSTAYLGRVNSLNEMLAASGQIASAPQLRERIKQQSGKAIDGRIYSEEEITKAVVGAGGAVHAKVSADQKYDAGIVTLLAKSHLLGEADATNVGINYANFLQQKSEGGFQGASDEQLQDYAYQAEVYVGGPLDPKELTFLSRANDKPQALKLIAAAHQRDENGKTLLAILDETKGDPSRIDRLLENPHGKQKLAIRDLQLGANQIRTVSLSDDISAVKSEEATHMAIADAQSKTATDVVNAQDSEDATKNELRRELRLKLFKLEHPFLYHFSSDSYIKYGPSDVEDAALTKGEIGPYDRDKGIKLMQDQLIHLQEINSKLSTNPALKNGSEGQK